MMKPWVRLGIVVQVGHRPPDTASTWFMDAHLTLNRSNQHSLTPGFLYPLPLLLLQESRLPSWRDVRLSALGLGTAVLALNLG